MPRAVRKRGLFVLVLCYTRFHLSVAQEAKMGRILMMVMGLMLTQPAWAVEVEGVDVPDSAVVAGKTLSLNGAGVRTKFFFDIYVGALYLPAKATTAEQVLAAAGPKRITMTFLYGEVGRDKLVDGWIAGFEKNQSKAAMDRLKTRLEQFNAMFADARKGERFAFDFLGDGSTVVTLKGRQVGTIAGADFQRALLQVWLGGKPADKGLKQAMLGGR